MSAGIMYDDEISTYEADMQSVTSYTSEFGQTAQKKTQKPLNFPFLSKEENEKLTLEIAKLLSSDHGKPIMRAVAQRINKDIKTISQMFLTMLRRLKNLDDKRYSSVRFHERFEGVHKDFNTTIDNSRIIAQNIGTYAEDFEDLIRPLYEDTSISVDQKKELIQAYINRAEQQAEKSKKEKDEFEKLLARFNILVDDFNNFTKDDQIILEVEIAHRKDMGAKKAEINGYNDRLADMKKAREELIKMGEDNFLLMQKSLYSIIMIWDSAKSDATEIVDMLSKAIKIANVPLGLRILLKNPVSTFKLVALYFRGYATGSTRE
ncbi:hypothetical protein N7466_003065 [Penicillium verhagenii]|uniref:uncharacterized protein n=1 Tax=Penicillium verhagenii TaxID=1562060 RepID=UPI002545BB2B|nr:uncharacterized protein N7466_003065 [Penicillium verhagenii]KAJ5936615.1 hypothetical protein N7466_003065 [Penicillium verhagenii]